MEKKVCCICGKEIAGWGNNPWGALDKNGEEIKWKPEDECCNVCNSKYVAVGRIAKLYKAKKEDIVKLMPDRLVNKSE